jgi:hypothetical protein
VNYIVNLVLIISPVLARQLAPAAAGIRKPVPALRTRRRVRRAFAWVRADPLDRGIVASRANRITFVDAAAPARALEPILFGGTRQDHAGAVVRILMEIVDARVHGIGATFAGILGVGARVGAGECGCPLIARDAERDEQPAHHAAAERRLPGSRRAHPAARA